jgi:serine/threonine-protein kinase RsbW
MFHAGLSLTATLSIFPPFPRANRIAMIMATATGYDWDKITFASTLFLCPILDRILSSVPRKWHAEIRLGLQEALVNAAKHGNNLDPQKQVVVSFCLVEDNYWWMISDEGCGFQFPCGCAQELAEKLPNHESESGRGMSMLHQIFDRVVWNRQGTELLLCKQLNRKLEKEPLVC